MTISRNFVLPLMLFLHVIDDFCLQPIILNKLKQKSWWEANAPDRMYRNDYRMALAAHAFSWAFSAMLPVALYFRLDPPMPFYAVMMANAALHYVVDDMKANRHALNLVIDQSIHVFQILATYVFMCLV